MTRAQIVESALSKFDVRRADMKHAGLHSVNV